MGLAPGKSSLERSLQILHPTPVTSSPVVTLFLSDVFLHWLQILDRVADGIVFGALLPCEECSGQLVFKSDAYYCTGDVTAWTKCMVKTQTPNRKEWVTPKVSGGSWGLLAKKMVPPFRVCPHFRSPGLQCSIPQALQLVHSYNQNRKLCLQST